MKLLVHACCGPCSIMPTRLLMDEGHNIAVLYANSNITPRAEYKHRLEELQRYGTLAGFPVIEGIYDPDAWEHEVAPLQTAENLTAWGPRSDSSEVATQDGQSGSERCPNERSERVRELLRPDKEREPQPNLNGVPKPIGSLDDEYAAMQSPNPERCRACYRMRLREAAAYAADQGFEALTTTLAVSPYQFSEIMHEELDRACAETGVQPLFRDFRPYYDEATRISRELGMYRQNYCGCRFSVQEAEATRARIKAQRAAEKAARAAATADERAREEAVRAEKRAAKQAYAEEQARKNAIRRALREQNRKATPDN